MFKRGVPSLHALHGTNDKKMRSKNGWIHVSENSAKGNARKTDGFWTEVKDYVHKKTNSDKRTYDMVCGKWKTVCPNVTRFCGVHDNAARMAQESRAEDEDYFNKALLDYACRKLDYRLHLLHCWEEIPKNNGSGTKQRLEERKGRSTTGSSMNMNTKQLARLMDSELAT
ncbi:hypothetical protein Tco_1155107 [Tanacetum coccineum]